ncbi:MAG: DNA polymerase III subunit delta [Bacteroidales bacterium]|nr:DNA polymerase III subunit delta [Candidatus Minthousia equi]MDO4956111.1 DNA polymerase III subunit delta [Bacteroidales bacterium]
MAKQELTYESVVRSVQNREFKPIYYLMGEESYYIDRISDYIASQVLTEEQKDFNLTVMYGSDTNIANVLTAAKRFPMMSDYQVVIVKEAQNLKNIDDLSFYLKKPQPQTILVFCHKNGVLDRRKKVIADVERVGVLFESKKLRDYQLPAFIVNYVRNHKSSIDEKAAVLLAEFIGSDLNRMAGEIDKLMMSMPEGQSRITPELIERNIGVSKEFNSFELRSALIEKDVLKANRIAKYFNENSKANPIQKTLATLFGFFSNLMLAHYAPEKSESGVMEILGMRQSWQVKEYMAAMRVYSARKTMNIISAIRQTDAKSKGVGNSSISDGDLLRELIYYILH